MCLLCIPDYKTVRRHSRLSYLGLWLPLSSRIRVYADETLRNLLSNVSLLGITRNQPAAWYRGRFMNLLVSKLVSVFPTFCRTY